MTPETRDYLAMELMGVALLECPRPVPRDSWQGGRLSSQAPAYIREMQKWRKDLLKTAYELADLAMVVRDDRT